MVGVGAYSRLGAYLLFLPLGWALIRGENGIPAALEQDCYFDLNKRNLIVFGDQMIDARKEKRIVNFFSRGSHYRNLSMIYIAQNLFRQGKGSRSISLKLSIHTLIQYQACF